MQTSLPLSCPVARRRVLGMKTTTICLLLALTATAFAHPTELRHWEIASRDPDRIYLTFNGDPATDRAISWRTSADIKTAYAEIAPALGAPGFPASSRLPCPGCT